MKTFIRSFTAGVFLLLLGLRTSNAQEVTFSAGPSMSIAAGAANGGFAWADLYGTGNLDVFIPSINIIRNNITTFVQDASATVNIPLNTNSVGGLFADFNGDGVPDLFTTNGGTASSGLFYNTAGVFVQATGTGDLATAGVTGEVFQGASASPIDHSNYLSLCWPGNFTGIAGSNQAAPVPGGGAMWLLKGGASGFTNVARGAAASNLAIDTSLSFESWDVRFFDANNDGWQDLLMPSFRNGFSKVDTGTSGARKGCVLFLNDGTGKFTIPTGTYALDTAGTFVTRHTKSYTGGDSTYLFDSLYVVGVVKTDTGIVVDDTVRHFAAIGEQWGDLNNDGNMDLILNGLNATDNMDGNGNFVADVILYGKGDGTFTYKWDGVHVVANGLVQATNQRAIDVGDYNNDGLADIYTSGTYGAQHLYRNNGDGTFTDVAALDALTAGGQRAGQFVDYNNDGFLDVYMYTGGNSVLQKNNGNTNKWIGFIPIGTGHNMSAIGAVFTVYTGSTKQIRVIKAEGGSAGMGGEVRANFGLGAAAKIDSVNVRWPDGTNHTYNFGAANNTIALNKYYTIQEGSVIPSAPLTMRPSWAAGDTSLASTDTLSWHKAVSGAGTTKYQVQIASNAAFSTIVKTVSSLSDTSTIVKLGLSTKYYWRVQALDNMVPGPYSAIDSFRTKVQPCTTTPALVYPVHNPTDVASKPTLKVSYVPTASTYHFQLDTLNATMTHLIVNDSTSDFDTTWAVTQSLKPSKIYYWRVRGYNPAGSSAWSGVDSFTVMYLPAIPVKVYPTPNQANVPINPVTLQWRHEAGDSNYVVQIWTYTSSGQALMVDTTKHDTSWTIPSGLINRFTYYWKVLCYNQGGASAFSAVDSFTTAIERPAAPVALSPKGSTDPSTTGGWPRRSTFAWKPATNAVWYHLQIASASDFSTASNIVLDTTMIPDTTFMIPDTLDAGTTYFYRLSSINLGGEGLVSGVSTFKTGTGVLGVNEPTNVPKQFALFQNFPNPFNPSTTIRYDLAKASYVRVTIYDVLGRAVANLVDGVQAARTYNIQWNAQRFASGVYFCRIEARPQDGSEMFSSLKKLLLMK